MVILKAAPLILLGILILIAIAVFASVQNIDLSYSRTYSDGSSSGDDSPDNCITVEPHIHNETSFFYLRYFRGNNTLYIYQENIENITLYWNKSIEHVAGADYLDDYAALMTGSITVKVYGTPGHKNITLISLPVEVSGIRCGSDAVEYSQSNGNLSVSGANGIYTVYFGSSGAVGESEGGEEAIGAFIDSCCFLLAILVLVAVILWRWP